MTSRRIDLIDRKNKVLSITIEQYINTVFPVSSKDIAKESYLDVSSATIRNIFAELEMDGYLMHPHTSSGRVPTQLGYRYYVDNLMDEISLLEEEENKIKEEYTKESLELDALLEKTSHIMSDMTNYTSIVSIDGCNEKIFCNGISCIVGYHDYKDLNKIKHILETLEEKERLLEIVNRQLRHKIDFFIGQELLFSNIEECSLAISKYKTKKGPSGRIAILGPTRMDYEKVVSILDYISNIMGEVI